MRKFLTSSWEVIEVAIIAFVAVFLIRTFLVQPFLVNGASMEPAFHNGDYLLIDVVTYRFREPERGEVVVFRYPVNESVFFIKRIIGLPGERVVVDEGKVVVYPVGGGEPRVIGEEYLPQNILTGGRQDVMLGDNDFFVMGDNRGYSFDSRNWGSVPRRDIVGIARLRLLPITKVQAFQTPEYSL
jgi:signal peptidase I